MIPHPMVSNEVFGNGLKDRVTACRKRLRLNRIHRGQIENQPEELFRETSIGASGVRGYLADAAALRGTFVEVVHARDDETSQWVDEQQEVGIT
jgi:hypothetical protein